MKHLNLENKESQIAKQLQNKSLYKADETEEKYDLKVCDEYKLKETKENDNREEK